MTIELSPGANTALPSGSLIVETIWTGSSNLSVDCVAFVLRADGRISGDEDFLFYNQPNHPSAGARLELAGSRAMLAVNPENLPSSTDRVVLALVVDGGRIDRLSSLSLSIRVNTRGTDDPAIVRFQPNLQQRSESSLILVELYKRNGQWKIRAVGQGFNGGLDPLARLYGVDVADEPGDAPVLGGSSLSPSVDAAFAGSSQPAVQKLTLEKRLISLEKTDPELADLVRKVGLSLEKKAISKVRARVALVLDISGSMDKLYRSGAIDRLVRRILALGLRLDDDGQIDVFLFGTEAHSYGAVDLENHRTFVSDMRRRHKLESGTYYGKTMKLVRDTQRIARVDDGLPTYVMFVTDGGTQDVRVSETQVMESSAEPIFWQFMAIGPRQAGVPKPRPGTSRRLPRGFDFLEHLDKMSGRVVDNAGFFSVEEPDELTEDELYELLMAEFPDWIGKARKAGVFR